MENQFSNDELLAIWLSENWGNVHCDCQLWHVSPYGCEVNSQGMELFSQARESLTIVIEAMTRDQQSALNYKLMDFHAKHHRAVAYGTFLLTCKPDILAGCIADSLGLKPQEQPCTKQ